MKGQLTITHGTGSVHGKRRSLSGVCEIGTLSLAGSAKTRLNRRARFVVFRCLRLNYTPSRVNLTIADFCRWMSLEICLIRSLFPCIFQALNVRIGQQLRLRVLWEGLDSFQHDLQPRHAGQVMLLSLCKFLCTYCICTFPIFSIPQIMQLLDQVHSGQQQLLQLWQIKRPNLTSPCS